MMTFALILVMHQMSFSQNSIPTKEHNKHYVVFIMDGIQSIEQARQIDADIKQQKGILVTRTNVPSAKYFAVYNTKSEIDKSWFETKFKSYGIEMKCYHEGVHGADKVENVTKENCNE